MSDRIAALEQALEAERKRADDLVAKMPRMPFDVRAADAMADGVRLSSARGVGRRFASKRGAELAARKSIEDTALAAVSDTRPATGKDE